MVRGVQVLRQYGIRPEDWDWFRVHGRVRPDPKRQHWSATWRAARKSLLLIVLVVVGVVLAMPVTHWAAVLLHVSLYQLVPLTLGVLLIGVVLLIAIFTVWAGGVRQAREEAIRRPMLAALLEPRTVCWPRRAGSGRAGLRRPLGERAAWRFLLELLLRIPGTTVCHGLQFPRHQEADEDHAVAVGNIVHLLDSKLYRWGQHE